MRTASNLELSMVFLGRLTRMVLKETQEMTTRERVLLANNAALDLLESTRQTMIGRSIWEVVRLPRIEELVGQALQGTHPERLEFRVARTQNVISVAVSPLPGTPCPGAVLVLHDERRRCAEVQVDDLQHSRAVG